MYRLFQLCHTDTQESVRGLVFLLLLLFLLMLLFKRNNYLLYMYVCIHVIPGVCKVQKRVRPLEQAWHVVECHLMCVLGTFHHWATLTHLWHSLKFCLQAGRRFCRSSACSVWMRTRAWFPPAPMEKPGVVVTICNPSAGRVGVGGSRSQKHSGQPAKSGELAQWQASSQKTKENIWHWPLASTCRYAYTILYTYTQNK